MAVFPESQGPGVDWTLIGLATGGGSGNSNIT